MKALLAILGGLAVLTPGLAAERTLAVDKAHSRVEVAVKATVDSLDPAPAGGYVARGRLRLHGIDQRLEFPVTVTSDGLRYSIDGSVKLDTRDFGLEVIRKLLVLKVDPQVQVRFHLQGSLANL